MCPRISITGYVCWSIGQSVGPSVSQSVGRSVGPSVGPSVTHSLKLRKININDRGLHYGVTGYAVTRKTRLEVGRLVPGRSSKQGENEGKKKKGKKKRKKMKKSDLLGFY